MTPASFIEKTTRHKRHRIHSKVLTTPMSPLLEPFRWRFVFACKSSVFLVVALVAGQSGNFRRKLPTR